ncbi:GNVR domain-containing protein [uncultured Cyclobacterium sp.]|uniref:GumC family protein n=1 Tax=uncultured Cyclobacterium sp. TaxID=453820 RepID=UPI0030EE54C0|tara:strand:+ start:128868 stop:131207 length:2340 start_codon:yes stop_codon:yes gene_type:complete
MNIKEFLSLEVDLNKSTSQPLEFYLKKYLRLWYFFILSVFICITIGIIHLYLTPSQFEIASTLLINSVGENKSGLTSNAVLDDLDGYQISHIVENEVEVLTSVSLIHKTLQELSMYINFYVEDNFHRNKEIYGKEVPINIIYHQLSDRPKSPKDMVVLDIIDKEKFILEIDGIKNQYFFGEKILVFFGEITIYLKNDFDSSYPRSLLLSYNNLRKLSYEYQDYINATPTNKLSTVISLSLLEPSPEKGEQILSKLVEVYNTEALKKINSTAANTLTFIDQQLVKLTSELTEIERDVENYKNKNAISDLSAEAMLYLENSNEAKQKLSDYDINLEVLQNLEENLSINNPSVMVQGSLLIDDTNLSDLVNKYNELLRERKRLLTGITSDNPLAKTIDNQISNLKIDLVENIKSNKNSIQIAKKRLESNESEIEQRANRVPEIERELLEITRQQTSKQENYQFLMKKREEAILSLAATSVSNARIIDPPMASLYPTKPKKKLIFMLALFIGVSFPIGFIFLIEHFVEKIRIKEDLESLTKVPIMGEISSLKKQKNRHNSPSSNFLVREQISLIWSNMKFLSSDQENQTILVSSSVGGEGKTFFSINLAKSIASSGKRVVILEFDLRKPATFQQLGMRKLKPGIAEYLLDDKFKTHDILQLADDYANIFLVNAGKSLSDLTQIMNSPRLANLFEELREKFDHIIIDSAPIGLVADAFALSPFIDMLAYVVRYYQTKPSHIKLINNISQKDKFKNAVLILNDAKSEHTYTYEYGYYYDKKYAKT